MASQNAPFPGVNTPTSNRICILSKRHLYAIIKRKTQQISFKSLSHNTFGPFHWDINISGKYITHQIKYYNSSELFSTAERVVCWFPPRLAPSLRYYYNFDNLCAILLPGTFDQVTYTPLFL